MSAPTPHESSTATTFAREVPRRIAIVGGGLAGLAAAVALSGRGWQVELHEARRFLGGRASSFADPESDELVDYCQHVSLGCCTNLAHLCQTTGLADAFERVNRLHFLGPDGRQHDLATSRWLPAPLHLGPSFLRMGFLSLGERCSIARTLWKLARCKPRADDPQTIGNWLQRHGQSARAIERFWSVVLVSALGESVDRAALEPARKVFVDGFMATRQGYEVLIPRLPLREIFSTRLHDWLRRRGVVLHLNAPVTRINVALDGGVPRATGLTRAERNEDFDAVVVAVPWRRVGELLASVPASVAIPWSGASHLRASPITGVHLWFDRPVVPLPHAVLVGRLSQWVFCPPWRASDARQAEGQYCQVVVSASRDLAGRDRQEIVREVRADLTSIWPAVASATLQRSRVVTDPSAVFSASPDSIQHRPGCDVGIRGLALAGDWIRTGWPATMEGAVRSGFGAAEVLLRQFGTAERVLQPDLPRGWLSRRLLGAS